MELTTLAPLGERVARRSVLTSRGETGEGVPSILMWDATLGLKRAQLPLCFFFAQAAHLLRE